MIKKISIIVGIILFLSMVISTTAGEGRLDFVETEVILLPDGKASIEYVVRWIVTSGEFHGFYLSGFDRLTPRFDYRNAAGIDIGKEILGTDASQSHAHRGGDAGRRIEEGGSRVELARTALREGLHPLLRDKRPSLPGVDINLPILLLLLPNLLNASRFASGSHGKYRLRNLP